jgi:hypothetical protein
MSYRTHRPVVGMEPEEQIRWLERAYANKWTEEDLRAAIRAEIGGTATVRTQKTSMKGYVPTGDDLLTQIDALRDLVAEPDESPAVTRSGTQMHRPLSGKSRSDLSRTKSRR